jgi:hypothetical protein
MSDKDLTYRDIKDSYVLTKLIERRAKESDRYDVPFAPLVPWNDRRVKLVVRHVDGSGLASFKADDAMTPVVKRGGDLTEMYFEIPLIAEKHPLTSTDLLDLESPHDRVAHRAANDILALGKQLRIRNMNRTKWMAWQAVQDNLVIAYPDGSQIAVDYDLDGDSQNSYFSGSHLVTAATLWSDTANADIIEDTFTWTKLIADDAGIDQAECIMHLNSTTWRYLKKNTTIRAELSTTNPRIITPRMNEVIEILEIAQIKIYNGYYTDESDVKHKYLPDGKVLFTGPYEINGEPIVEVKDGPVVRLVGDDLVVAPNPGALSEIYINAEQISKNIRVQTARLPVVNHPNAIVWATVA